MPIMADPLVMILICLLGAFILSEVFKLIGLPRVVGQITAGIIIGLEPLRTYVLGDGNLKLLNFLASLGIVLLFYYIGLEMNFRVAARYAKNSIVVSIFKALVPFGVGYFIASQFLGMGSIASIIIGIALSASAQSVSMDLLDELGMAKSKIGVMIISIGAITDLIELFVVTILLGALELSGSNIGYSKLFFDLSLFIIFILIARLWLIPLMLKRGSNKTSTSRFMASIILVLAIAALSEFLGIGALIGALVAGIIIRQTIFKDVEIPDWQEHDIARSIHIIAFGFLIPLFFVWVGASTDIQWLENHLGIAFVLALAALVSIIIGTIIAIKLTGGKLREGLTLGWGLGPKGDIGLVVTALALEAGILSEQMFSSLVLMVLIVTIISPVMFKRMLLNNAKSNQSGKANKA